MLVGGAGAGCRGRVRACPVDRGQGGGAPGRSQAGRLGPPARPGSMWHRAGCYRFDVTSCRHEPGPGRGGRDSRGLSGAGSPAGNLGGNHPPSSTGHGLVVEEDARVADEQFRVLKMRAVVGVRVQDELGVGQELLQDVGVDRRDDDVVAAVDDQDGKLQALEVGVTGVLGRAVRRERGALGGDGLIGDGCVAVGTGDDALDIGAPGRLAGLGRGEQDRQSHVFLPRVFAGEKLRVLAPVRDPNPRSRSPLLSRAWYRR